jgi:hypothetical protein
LFGVCVCVIFPIFIVLFFGVAFYVTFVGRFSQASEHGAEE